MHDFKGIPWQHFMEFISPTADRFAILKNLLEKAGLEYSVLALAGFRHIIVTPQTTSSPGHLPTILVAHYDRAEESPGANDNSTGVFILIEAAINLTKKNENNWRIIFTDGEELKPGESIQAQGSYSLAGGLKKSRIEKSRIFCFDTCGRGDTLIISTTLDYLIKEESGRNQVKKSLMELRNIALDTARELRMTKVLLAPTPFSDDAGFFRAGLAAQDIMLIVKESAEQGIQVLGQVENYIAGFAGNVYAYGYWVIVDGEIMDFHLSRHAPVNLEATAVVTGLPEPYGAECFIAVAAVWLDEGRIMRHAAGMGIMAE